MSTVRSSTARFLGSLPSVHTRRRYKKDIMTWQRFCVLADINALDGSAENAQAFLDWLSTQYTPKSAVSRSSGVRRWFDALLADGIIKGHGFRNIKSIPIPKNQVQLEELTENDLALIMTEAKSKGPRWEWLVGMIAYCGVDAAEALRVRCTDIMTVDARTVIAITSRRGTKRRIPVNGRLEMLTLGLASVFAPTTSLGGSIMSVRGADKRSDYACTQVGKIATAALGRRVTVQDLRRNAVVRQYRRGIEIPVIAKWMGHATDRWVKETLGLANPVDSVTQDDVLSQIVVEPGDALIERDLGFDSQLDACP